MIGIIIIQKFDAAPSSARALASANLRALAMFEDVIAGRVFFLVYSSFSLPFPFHQRSTPLVVSEVVLQGFAGMGSPSERA
jgi:hypothetical protein